MKNNLILLAGLFVFVACNNDDEETICPAPPIEKSNLYFPLTTGNYWVYEFQSQTPEGTPVGSVTIDSLIVIGDTLINDVAFKMLSTDKPFLNTIWFLRDSAGYVLSRSSMVLPPDPREDIYNAHYGFTPLGDTIYYYFDQFPRTEVVATNFGSENCLAQEATHEPYPNFGNDPVVDASFFASFGPVQRSYGYLSGGKMVGVLVDYHLE